MMMAKHRPTEECDPVAQWQRANGKPPAFTVALVLSLVWKPWGLQVGQTQRKEKMEHPTCST